MFEYREQLRQLQYFDKLVLLDQLYTITSFSPAFGFLVDGFLKRTAVDASATFSIVRQLVRVLSHENSWIHLLGSPFCRAFASSASPMLHSSHNNSTAIPRSRPSESCNYSALGWIMSSELIRVDWIERSSSPCPTTRSRRRRSRDTNCH